MKHKWEIIPMKKGNVRFGLVYDTFKQETIIGGGKRSIEWIKEFLREICPFIDSKDEKWKWISDHRIQVKFKITGEQRRMIQKNLMYTHEFVMLEKKTLGRLMR